MVEVFDDTFRNEKVVDFVFETVELQPVSVFNSDLRPISCGTGTNPQQNGPLKHRLFEVRSQTALTWVSN